MTDISDLREGDEIEVVMRLTCGVDAARNRRGGYYTFPYLFDIAERVTIIRPEIIPGKPYVDADGKLYVGLAHDRVTRVDDAGDVDWYGGEGAYREGNPLPAGLRAAKVVPES